jgi:hypothetical protein
MVAEGSNPVSENIRRIDRKGLKVAYVGVTVLTPLCVVGLVLIFGKVILEIALYLREPVENLISHWWFIYPAIIIGFLLYRARGEFPLIYGSAEFFVAVAGL